MRDDITLLLELLYYLYTERDKRQAIREIIDAMDSETFQLYLKYHFAICERGDLLGVTSHAVDIFKKK